MSLSPTKKAFLMHFSIFLILISLAVIQANSQTEDLAQTKQKAAELLQKDNYVDALPLLEKIVAAEPLDADSHFYLGFALLAKSQSAKDKDEAKQLRARARKIFQKAKDLGSEQNILDALIAGIPEDGGNPGQFSKNSEAETAMAEAESAFVSGKIDEALKLYQKALQLDPTIYEAALYSGDMYFRKEDFPNAEIWYQKAMKINPFRETAYRYSASPLMRQKKFDIARDRYIEAFIVEPYNRYTSIGLGQWGEATGTSLGHPRIDIPASVGKSENGNTTITLGMGDDAEDGSFAWTVYGIARATWQNGKDGALSDNFKKAYPNEKVYRHSLAEEYDALKLTATTLKARMNDKKNPVKKLNPQLEMLLNIYNDGLLEPYILMAKPDEGIAQDHEEYLKQNREKLRQYVVKYVILK